MARTFTIYSVDAEGTETYYDVVSSPAQGVAAHAKLKAEAKYVRCRDCLGGLRFEYNLKTGRKTT